MPGLVCRAEYILFIKRYDSEVLWQEASSVLIRNHIGYVLNTVEVNQSSREYDAIDTCSPVQSIDQGSTKLINLLRASIERRAFNINGNYPLTARIYCAIL